MSYNNIPLFCYGSLVDVNQVPFKYRAIYQNYQGINRKKLFFGTYAKILCKRHYVNHRNGKRTRRRLSSHKDKIWGLACKHRPHICSFPTEVQESSNHNHVPPTISWQILFLLNFTKESSHLPHESSPVSSFSFQASPRPQPTHLPPLRKPSGSHHFRSRKSDASKPFPPEPGFQKRPAHSAPKPTKSPSLYFRSPANLPPEKPPCTVRPPQEASCLPAEHRHQENPYQIDPQRSHASLQKDHPHCLSFSFFLAHKKPPLKHAHTRAYSKGGPFYDEIRSDHFSSVSAASSTTGASSTAGASSATGSAPFLPFFAGAAVAAASC